MNRSKRIVWEPPAAAISPPASGPASNLPPLDVFLGHHLVPHHWWHNVPIDPEVLSRGCLSLPPSGHLAFDLPSYMSHRVCPRNHVGFQPVPNSAGSKTTPVSVKLWESPGRAGGLLLLLRPILPGNRETDFLEEYRPNVHSTKLETKHFCKRRLPARKC